MRYVLALKKTLYLRLAHDRHGEPQQRLPQLVLEAMLRVDLETVLHCVDRVLALVSGSRVRLPRHDDEQNAVAKIVALRVALRHARCELNVCLVALVVLLRNRFGDDEERHIDAVVEGIEGCTLHQIWMVFSLSRFIKRNLSAFWIRF